MQEQLWIQEASDKIKRKMRLVTERSQGKIPYKTVNGVFDDWSGEKICWWTNGFWGGIMWQLYHATGDSIYMETAKELEKKQDANLMINGGMDHDSGFRWLPTAVADYRLTGREESKNRGMRAACDLAGRFNPVGRFIRAWNDKGDGSRAGWAIIDCMMNLPLLYWAYEETRDPRFLQIATMHADTAEKYFIRPDGSVNHIVEFNAVTGEFIQSFGGQGYGVGSSWTRGQAWALYGFMLSYLHTGNEKYLNASKRVAHYFIANIPESGLIPVDFRQPAEPAWEDSTAAAIAACGLLEIARKVSENEAHVYHDAALRLLKALYEKRCNWDDNCDNILEKCTAAYHDKEHEFTIIYGDYYFIEAIWKLTDQEIFIW
ncbi:MAG: glycoside hydrolase family 88 protein [Lachnospiraceae bacterium]|nr:glycoside hydrolase family 88 protein [Lachnospiraceae bacterium]